MQEHPAIFLWVRQDQKIRSKEAKYYTSVFLRMQKPN